MRTEHFEFTGHGGTPLHAICFMPEGEIRMILQITHGMTEHIGRYEAFARSMAAHGILAAGFDLRGHGRNPGDASVASLGPNGWQESIEDMRLFHALLHARYSGIPHVMLGFSLGSFLLREYLQKYRTDIDGAIIMGSGHQPWLLLTLMMGIVSGQMKKAGCEGTTPLVRKLSFGTYNDQFKPNRTHADWLCADASTLDNHIADPLCRRDISAQLFFQLLHSMRKTGIRRAAKNLSKSMPVLLLSGQDDPVGDKGKGVHAVAKLLREAGMHRVTCRLIPGARHMVLGENTSGAADEAHRQILDWFAREIRQWESNR